MSFPTLFHELIAFLVSLALLFAYHGYMRWWAGRVPARSVHVANRLARRRWVESIMETEGADVLAVQTLRNSVMASSFMASTSVLLIIGVFNLAADWDRLGRVWRSINALASGSQELHAIITMLLIFDFSCAFFFFSMAIRFYNHVGYMINLPPGRRGTSFPPTRVMAYLNRAGNSYSFGMRAFFFSLPLVFWFFGPQYMLLATLALIAVLYVLDRMPGEPLG